MKLSDHFTLAEAGRSQSATRLGIDNRPPDALHIALKAVAVKILEPIRAWHGKPFVPSSWYRSITLNSAIGGAKKSQHMLGEAVDIELPGVPNIELARWIEEHIDFDQLILEFWNPADPSAGWVHVSYREGLNRGDVLTIGKIGMRKGLPV